jgi:phosphoserine phosphatase RsbU/P
MRILIAEDDATSRLILETLLRKWDHDIVSTVNGTDAWAVLESPDPPRMAILDRMMPGADGLELCRRARELKTGKSTYIILLTAMGRKEDIVEGLDAGADDYLVKPFHKAELGARVRAGQRVLELQSELEAQLQRVEKALEHVRTLQGILPICMHCHKIKSDQASWQKLEDYIEDHSGATFSHGLCEECLEKHYPKQEPQTTDDPFRELKELSQGKHGTQD